MRPPVDSDDFHLAVAGLVNAPLRQGGEATILNNGNAFFPAMLEAIREAQRSINFMVYIWEPGTVSRMFTDALVECARAGVQVRVLLDGLGGIRAPLIVSGPGVKTCFSCGSRLGGRGHRQHRPRVQDTTGVRRGTSGAGLRGHHRRTAGILAYPWGWMSSLSGWLTL